MGNISTKVDGSWKEISQSYVKVNGEWKQATPWEKVDGTWKRFSFFDYNIYTGHRNGDATKYDFNGDVIWRYTDTNNRIYYSAVDNNKNYFIVESRRVSEVNRLVKLKEDGTKDWELFPHGTANGSSGTSSGIAVSGDGSVVSASHQSSSGIVRKWDSEGKLIFSNNTRYRHAGPSIDKDGYIYILRAQRESVGNPNAHKIRPDDGVSVANTGIFTSNSNIQRTTLVHPDGTVYYFAYAPRSDFEFVNLVDSSSFDVFKKGGSNLTDDIQLIQFPTPMRERVDLDRDRNLYYGRETGELYKIDKDLNIVWSKNFNGEIDAVECTLDNHLMVYSDGDNKLHKVNANGSIVWSKVIHNRAYTISVDPGKMGAFPSEWGF